MKQIIAMGGGGFSMEPDNLALDRYIMVQTDKVRPKVCFLPQASAEAEGYVVRFFTAFTKLNAIPSWFSLFGKTPDGWQDQLLDQDVIYVGGGNTRSMLAVWREWGMDEVLQAALNKGVVLAGISAGAICWFEEGITDSVWPLGKLDCLGFLPGSCCSHYDGEAERRPAFTRMIAEDTVKAGLALDDGAAAHFVDGELKTIVTSRPNAHGYWLENINGQTSETRLDRVYLNS